MCPLLCRTWHLGNLIKVRGVVTRRSGVFPQLSLVKWDCGRCGTTMGPFVVGDNADDVKPKQCVACQAKGGFTVRGGRAAAVVVEHTLGLLSGALPPRRQRSTCWCSQQFNFTSLAYRASDQ